MFLLYLNNLFVDIILDSVAINNKTEQELLALCIIIEQPFTTDERCLFQMEAL